MKSFKSLFASSLRNQMMALFVIVAMVPLFITTYLSYQKASETVISQTKTQLGSMAEQQASVISTFINERVRSVKVLANKEAVVRAAQEQAAGGVSPETLRAASQQLKIDNDTFKGNYENLFMADKSGKVFADASGGTSIGLDLSTKAYFKEAVAGKIYVDQPALSSATGKLICVIAAPVVDASGKVQAMVGGPISLATLSQKLSENKIGEKGYSFMMDSKGLAVIYPDEKQVLKTNFTEINIPALAEMAKKAVKGEHGVGEYTFDGSQRLTGYAPVEEYEDYKGQGHSVCVVGYASEVLEPLMSLLQTAIAVAIGALVLVILVAFIVARGMAAPLVIIKDFAEHVAVGDILYDIGEEHRKKTIRQDEIGHIADAFRAVRQYLVDISESAEAIARGNLTTNVTPKCDKDVLSNAFVDMLVGLRSSIGKVSMVAGSLNQASTQLASASEQAGSATQQIATTIQEVARGNQDQSASVQETTASVEQLGRAIDQIALGSQEQAKAIEKTSATVNQLNGYINKVAALSDEVHSTTEQSRTAAASGGESVQKTLSGMAAVKESTTSVGKHIQELASHSEQIGQIVEAIDDIAEQTNLLALNAAIEAARAGEHGRGFAVVADEVRKLAERSSRETKQIANLISQVQHGTHEAVTAMELGSKEVDQGLQLAEEAGDALKGILEGARASAEQVGQIVSAVKQMEAASRQVADQMDSVSAVVEEATASAEEMAASSQQVTAAIEKIAAVSEETSASAEEVSASTEEMSAQVEEIVAQAEELARMASELQAAVSIFKLDEGQQPGEGQAPVLRRRVSDWSEPGSSATSQRNCR